MSYPDVREAVALADRLVELAGSWGGRTQRRYRSIANLNAARGTDSGPALERLCAMNWAERGFEVVCSACGVASFVPT